ncbi:MAG: hypothetical protein P1P84_00565 [Deferrisomatales bacterium]|nr:hypothetical protein [Deferrisomatales bacterium]
MSGHPHIILALGLALALSGCAAYPPGSAGTTPSGPGEGFTNSRLRTALYEWSPEDASVRQACLQNSLVLFTLLQECAGLPGSKENISPDLRFDRCVIRPDHRIATFAVTSQVHRLWTVEVKFDNTDQRFSLTTAPQG